MPGRDSRGPIASNQEWSCFALKPDGEDADMTYFVFEIEESEKDLPRVPDGGRSSEIDIRI